MHTHPPHVRDERLAWLAVEPALRHGFWARLFGRGRVRSGSPDLGQDAEPTPDLPGIGIGAGGGQPVPPYQVSPQPIAHAPGTVVAPTIGGTPTANSGPDNFPLSRKMQRYAVAVDHVVPRLSDDERVHLRRTGEVPSWFLDAVRKELKSVHF